MLVFMLELFIEVFCRVVLVFALQTVFQFTRTNLMWYTELLEIYASHYK